MTNYPAGVCIIMSCYNQQLWFYFHFYSLLYRDVWIYEFVPWTWIILADKICPGEFAADILQPQAKKLVKVLWNFLAVFRKLFFFYFIDFLRESQFSICQSINVSLNILVRSNINYYLRYPLYFWRVFFVDNGWFT